MIDLLFGWMTKTQYEITFLDGVLALVEVWIVIILVAVINVFINSRR